MLVTGTFIRTYPYSEFGYGSKIILTLILFLPSVVDRNTLNLEPDPEFWPNLDPDPDPGL